MVEVFKTNITDIAHANMIVERIHKNFQNYQANFDLDDCDHILRIECFGGSAQLRQFIEFLNELGCEAEVLPDNIYSFAWQLFGSGQSKVN